MRLTIIHDSEGNITAFAVYPTDGPAAYPATESGALVTQVEVREITDKLGAQEMLQRLSDLAENYRVDVESKARLTRKVDRKGKLTRK